MANTERYDRLNLNLQQGPAEKKSGTLPTHEVIRRAKEYQQNLPRGVEVPSGASAKDLQRASDVYNRLWGSTDTDNGTQDSQSRTDPKADEAKQRADKAERRAKRGDIAYRRKMIEGKVEESLKALRRAERAKARARLGSAYVSDDTDTGEDQ